MAEGEALKEVTVNTIRDGVIQTLSFLFPGMDVYGEKIKQGFEAPCFFVKLLTGSQDKELGRRYSRSYAFDIHYFPEGEDINLSAHDMAERLYELQNIDIQGGKYRLTGTSHEIVDDVLHFFVDINFMVMKQKDNVPKMQTLTQEGKARGY